jgi:hypothetical protein
MMIRSSLTAALLLAASTALLPAYAKSMTECAAQWQTMKTAGQTASLKYKDFSKSCMTGGAAAAATPAAPAPVVAAPAVKPATVATALAPAPTPAKPRKVRAKTVAPVAANDPSLNTDPAQAAPAAPTITAPAGVVFPRQISAQYASESAGKARMHTCLDAYHQNKDANSLGGLVWIQKGGGFYSLCNASLKG